MELGNHNCTQQHPSLGYAQMNTGLTLTITRLLKHPSVGLFNHQLKLGLEFGIEVVLKVISITGYIPS